MEKKLVIEGMKCAHCKAAVEKALGEIDGVTDAQVDLETKTAVIQMEKDIPDSVFTDAVKNKGFEPVRFI